MVNLRNHLDRVRATLRAMSNDTGRSPGIRLTREGPVALISFDDPGGATR
jgi:hypothetical protein